MYTTTRGLTACKIIFSCRHLGRVLTRKIVFVLHRIFREWLHVLGSKDQNAISNHQVRNITTVLKCWTVFFLNTLYSFFTSAVSIGQLQPLLIKIDKCKYNECVPIGLNTDRFPGRGVFNAGTAFFAPYCSEYILLLE